jgi:integrase
MASIHKLPGKPNWCCAFYDPEGFRRLRSTGTTNQRIAKTICVNIERASVLARNGKLSNEKALKLIRETCSAIEETHGKLAANQAHDILKANVEGFVKIAGGELTTYTIRSWLDTWLNGKTDASKATIVEYRRIVDLFMKFLGARADRALTTLQEKQVEDFKAELANRVSPSTVNKAVKVLKASFSNAVAKRQIEFSPAEHVEAIETEAVNRRPFTASEIAKLLTAADSKEVQKKLNSDGSEWRTMILIGFYTGLRLRDCANLTWREVDLLKAVVSVETEKTGRIQVLPLAEPLLRHLHTLAGDNPDAPLCPTLRGKDASKLSAAFYLVMVEAKLVKKRDHQGMGKGREAARETSRISFHSLRYNTTSALKSAGVSDSVAMDIVGHETEAVSRNYTKIADDAKRAAINKLPDITQ